jgi:hypothetical protein
MEGDEDESKTSVWYRELQEDPDAKYVQSYYIQQLESDDSGHADAENDDDEPESSPFVSKR